MAGKPLPNNNNCLRPIFSQYHDRNPSNIDTHHHIPGMNAPPFGGVGSKRSFDQQAMNHSFGGGG